MPGKIGQFISQHVYDGKLKSNHAMKDYSCLAFVDVKNGKEKKSGTSWSNEAEAQVIIDLVRLYYHDEDFCVITPYDAQRSLLEESFRTEGLPWENRIFNVDSFQGNEADYIVVSLVRSTGAGFLTSLHRVNVMLTRCKKGMVIVTRRDFIRVTDVGVTIIGKLMEEWEKKGMAGRVWVDSKDASKGSVNLPGKHASQETPPLRTAQPQVHTKDAAAWYQQELSPPKVAPTWGSRPASSTPQYPNLSSTSGGSGAAWPSASSPPSLASAVLSLRIDKPASSKKKKKGKAKYQPLDF